MGFQEDVQVLEVAAGQVVVGNDLDLAVAGLADDDVVAQVVGAALDLDAVLEELLESGHVEDLVVGGLRSVDDELAQTCQQTPVPVDSALSPPLKKIQGR